MVDANLVGRLRVAVLLGAPPAEESKKERREKSRRKNPPCSRANQYVKVALFIDVADGQRAATKHKIYKRKVPEQPRALHKQVPLLVVKHLLLPPRDRIVIHVPFFLLTIHAWFFERFYFEADSLAGNTHDVFVYLAKFFVGGVVVVYGRTHGVTEFEHVLFVRLPVLL